MAYSTPLPVDVYIDRKLSEPNSARTGAARGASLASRQAYARFMISQRRTKLTIPKVIIPREEIDAEIIDADFDVM